MIRTHPYLAVAVLRDRGRFFCDDRAVKKNTPIAVIVLVAVGVLLSRIERGPTVAEPGSQSIVEAFEAKRSGVWVEAEGPIVHILPFDDKPPRHQNFLVEIAPNHTVKISHNVDLAPRVVVKSLEEPAQKEAGQIVPDVDTLIEKLKNEAKVI